MRSVIIFLMIILSVCSVRAQKSKRIDSLKQTLKLETAPKKRALTLLQLAKGFQRTNRDTSRHYSDQAVNIAKELKNDSLLAASYFRQAYSEYYTSNDTIALNLYGKIDSLAINNNALSKIVIETKIYRSEISKFTFTIEGVLKAKEYLIEGIDLAQEINDTYLINKLTYRLASWHGFIAQEVAPEKHLDSAKVLAIKTLSYFLKIQDHLMVSKNYETLATIEGRLKNISKMDFYDNKRAQTLQIIGDSIQIASLYYSRASSYRRRENPQIGLAYMDSAKTIYEKIGYPNDTEKKNMYRDYGYLYSLSGDFENAFENMQKALVQSYTVYKTKNTNAAQEMEAKYESKKKEQEIALLQAKNEIVEAQKKNQRSLLLGGLGLTSITGLFLFLGFRNRKKTNNKLRELDTMKSSFFENISHEFRTPLSLIAGPVEQQLQKPDIDVSEKKNLTIAKRNTKRLLTLVDQLLDLSKLEAGHFKLKVQQGDLSIFLKSLTSTFDYLAHENNQAYTVHINIPENIYYFDADALEKIITNLISNALKYSPDGESIEITGTIQHQELQFIVKNTGAPLPEEALQTIFNRFARTDEQTTGTGIGLALSRELATLHKGTITVQSDDSWTSFTTTLPVTETAFSASEKATGTVNTSAFAKADTTILQKEIITEDPDIFSKDTNPILLIVDDNADLRTYVSSLFEDTYTIHTAQDGSEGFEIASSIVPDLIITDLMMPKDDGIALTKNCKTTEATSHIPIVMLTAKAGDENRLTGLENGADAYITKPFNTEILKTTTHNLLETRKKLQERFSQEVVLIPKDMAVNSADERFLGNLKEIVDTQIIESDFTTESFSKALGMSRMQLHRKLKALTGLSATEFIRSQRLKLAAQLLKKSDINVSQVGYSVGFNNHSYFTKCFKEHYGVSPSDYAKKS